MSIVPMPESPACKHPEESCDDFDLIDALVCRNCGAVLKYYGEKQAPLRGVNNGWVRLTAELLNVEVYAAMRSMVDTITEIQELVGANSDSIRNCLDWSTNAYETARKLRARGAK